MGPHEDLTWRKMVENDEIDEAMFEDEIANHMDFGDGVPVVDAYFHHKSCRYYVIEGKPSRGVHEAIKKFKVNIPLIRSRGKRVDGAIIIAEKIDNRCSRIYTRADDYTLLHKENKKPVKINGVTVKLIYSDEVIHAGPATIFTLLINW